MRLNASVNELAFTAAKPPVLFRERPQTVLRQTHLVEQRLRAPERGPGAIEPHHVGAHPVGASRSRHFDEVGRQADQPAGVEREDVHVGSRGGADGILGRACMIAWPLTELNASAIG